jgi:polyisoprenoid-binding protein YceI
MNTTEGLVASYILDAAKSRFLVKATATGLLSAFGHNPTFAIRRFTGEAWFRLESPERSSVRMRIDANSLTVTGDVNDKDRNEMERAMREDVLETARYPEIMFESSTVQANKITAGMYRMTLGGKLTLHGVARDKEIPCNVTVGEDGMRAHGEFRILQTHFAIKLVSVAGGTLKMKDELKFSFDITGHRQREAGQ